MATVLICDDAAFMRMTLRAMIEKQGFTVIGEAADGVEAVRKYNELNPDIVTMDLTMPEMDGISATREIKNADPEARIVIVSAMTQQSVVIEAMTAGARNFIVKPFKEEKVAEVLNSLI